MSHAFFSVCQAWMASPSRVGAVAPSGTPLAELITSEITTATGPILELGPGTGVFTYQLLKRGIRQQDLTLVEYGSDFMRLLQIRFPGARVLWMDAARLAAERIFDGAPVGLPLLNVSKRKVISILGGAFSYLRPGGAFYQFTYGMRCPVPRPILDRLGLKATLVDRTLRTVPPAAVYRLTRRPQARLIVSNTSTLQPQTAMHRTVRRAATAPSLPG